MAVPEFPRSKKKLRILVLSEGGDLGVALAFRFQQEGHKSELYVSAGKTQKMSKDTGRGLVQRREEIPTSFREFDLVVCNGRGFTRIVEQAGVPVIGPSTEATKIETDRAYGMAVLKKAGVPIPKYEYFTNAKTALQWLHKQSGRWVLKPQGAHALSWLTYSAKQDDNTDLIGVMETTASQHPELLKEGFILQQFIEDGIEQSAGSYFNGKDFITPYQLNFEHKGLTGARMPGPPTGEMGSTSFYTDKSKLFAETTKKLGPYLKSINYVGDVDLNTIVTEKGPTCIEITSRLGFPACCLQMYAFSEQDFGSFLHGVATGETKTVEVSDPWQTAVNLVTLPFPLESQVRDTALYSDWPVSGPLTEDPRLHPLDIYRDGEQLKTTGSGYVCVATGSGRSIEASQDEAQDALEQVHVPFGLARDDIGERVKEAMPRLKKWGYL